MYHVVKIDYVYKFDMLLALMQNFKNVVYAIYFGGIHICFGTLPALCVGDLGPSKIHFYTF